MTALPNSRWDSNLYDNRHGFVSEYGKPLISYLGAKEGEHICDLGCGTGDLAAEIAKSGAQVIGIDASAEMIKQAKAKYPHLQFEACSIYDLTYHEAFNAIFSNATLHWVKDAQLGAARMLDALKPGGRLVAELGGHLNVESIRAALHEELNNLGITDIENRDPWYFPTVGEYATVLENAGFRVAQAVYYDRPTPLEEGREGLQNWIKMFGGSFFEGLSPDEIDRVITRIEKKLTGKLWKNHQWIADYKRLYIQAYRP